MVNNFKFVFKELRNPDVKGEQFSVRVVDLKKGEFDFGFFDEKDNLQKALRHGKRKRD